ncbi:hypothetical protein QUH73_10120 [Labilibaculum sp. K2S]|uniref:hypothetical protein n=1 Tax=Labilibaculum sp. K2S TaxID=3056386 RepID=UPI0025A44E9C|nr:hypothetical protein [Labilibaculum sp. K2S]MDM8160168.1 hypothetical protein [Labilibaculum sp. K2S]
MKYFILLFICLNSCLFGCSQEVVFFDNYLQTIPKLDYPLDTKIFDSLFVRITQENENEYLLDLNDSALKKYHVFKSHSFDITSLKEPYNFKQDGVGFKCPLGYLDADKYKIVLYLHDVYTDFDYICISAVLYNNDGSFLYKDENESIIECMSASYIDGEYFRMYSIWESAENVVHFGTGSSGDYKSKTKITNEGFVFIDLNK